MSTSNRIIKPGYESYQPVVAARQFGLGQVSPHFFLHHLTESRADLPDILTGQRCYSFFDALAIHVPHNLSFTSSTDDFETWWSMWKTHAFRRALGPLLKQLDANMISLQNRLLQHACISFYGPLKKTPVRRHSPVEGTRAQTDDTSSGEVEEVLMPSTTLDLATSKSVADKAVNLSKPTAETQEPITSSSAVPLVLGKGCDLSSLLTFDPESIEPATSKASEESGPSATHGQLQHLKALLSSSIETLVEDPEEVKSILEDIQPHLPVTLRETLAGCDSVATVKGEIGSIAELEILRKELEDLEERVRVTKHLIQDKEALIAHSHEAKASKSIKTDPRNCLNKQTGDSQDEDDEAEIAEVDRVRANASMLLSHSFSRVLVITAQLSLYLCL
ncbi:hypothetical protein QYE76_014688 [Lolium multiflorum]|uniref:Uncharacterized protein n=1 Tax=Lolium multiflorum TaxID=4521 RepID=A0AAD8U2Z4_LOLMU|nr:hypothetical protein QYE76_014688 [Lolium multiflorum]